MPADTRQFYIDGRWVDPSSPVDLDVVDPSTEERVATISLGADADTDAAVAAAVRAFDGWAATTVDERLVVMRRLLELYRARSGEMATIISREMGAPIDLARDEQAAAGEDHIDAAIRALEGFEFEAPLEPDAPGHRVLLEPVGVCALVTPWNWPMNQVALKVMPALATGCTMVLKPSELSPLSAMLFVDLLHEAGVPPGVVNLVNGDGAGVGTRLTGHPDVSMVSFTGSSRAGIEISRNAAHTLKRVSLELGGKGANLVFADAADDAVRRGVAAVLENTGQSCDAPTRMLVERARYAEAVEQAAAAASAATVGEASAHGDRVGPLVSATQRAKVVELIESGEREGARLVAGGPGRPDGLERGHFVRPTVFADCRPDMRVWREEIFGPVLSMMPFDTEEDAVRLANDTEYGLANYVQTSDPGRAERLARRMRSGMVEINAHPRAAHAPFGGYKRSGNGREGGRHGFHEFLEVKAVRGWPA